MMTHREILRSTIDQAYSALDYARTEQANTAQALVALEFEIDRAVGDVPDELREALQALRLACTPLDGHEVLDGVLADAGSAAHALDEAEAGLRLAPS